MDVKSRSPLVPALVAIVLIAFLGWSMLRRHWRAEELRAAEKARSEAAAGDRAAVSGAENKARANALAAEARRATRAAFRERLAAHLDNEHMRRNEVSLAFRDAEAFRKFLGRAEAAGLTVLAGSEVLLAARVRYSSLDALAGEIVGNAADYEEAGGNFIASIPGVPVEDRAERRQVPVRNHLLEAAGAPGMDNSGWGRGVTIAVIDSGVAADATFGQGRVRALDIGLGVSAGAGEGHGTAVASLAAGAAADAPGVAPMADVLSIRVTDTSGASDMFTIAQAIVAAVDNGAQVVNVSLGGYGGGAALTRAIEYAVANGAVVVAAAGNDQASRLVWPAANVNVVSVGATDAVQEQVVFSNSGWQLQITAPGYVVRAAWTDGERIDFTGTSASSPVVAGAIAAVMSVNPGMSAQEAWAVLQAHADDAGAPGRDDDYGAGVIDLGWAMERSDPARVDTAVSGHHYNARDGTVDVVVQNRSAVAMSGMTLVVEVNGAVSNVALPWVDAGASTVVKVPVAAGAQTVLRTTLVNADGVADKNAANNSKASAVTPGGGG